MPCIDTSHLIQSSMTMQYGDDFSFGEFKAEFVNLYPFFSLFGWGPADCTSVIWCLVISCSKTSGAKLMDSRVDSTCTVFTLSNGATGRHS